MVGSNVKMEPKSERSEAKGYYVDRERDGRWVRGDGCRVESFQN